MGWKKLALILALVLPITTYAQTDVVQQPAQRLDAPFRLFSTQNIYTLLKLDTRTGQVWQVQWGTDDGYTWTAPINALRLFNGDKAGRFTLYPTQNIYNFILLDQEDGRTWQVQWNLDEKKRMCIPIEGASEVQGKQ